VDISTEQFDWTMKTNIYAPFWIIKAARPTMGRPGMPAELGGIYVQLADNQSSFATGQIYGSAGGSGQP
jgi:NAD(P)-dependent dehydrogenase (short-subunit alcohol dehydrogenase family)